VRLNTAIPDGPGWSQHNTSVPEGERRLDLVDDQTLDIYVSRPLTDYFGPWSLERWRSLALRPIAGMLAQWQKIW
jgi:hypothetical protein